MITREQVADLQPGDVVEISAAQWPEGTVVRGPLWLDGDTLHCAGEYVRHYDGSAPHGGATQTLTVVSRTPRPLYVNHPRTEPVPGDVVRDADADGIDVWMFADPDDPGFDWRVGDPTSGRVESAWTGRDKLPARLRLLVDGETGQVVQP